MFDSTMVFYDTTIIKYHIFKQKIPIVAKIGIIITIIICSAFHLTMAGLLNPSMMEMKRKNEGTNGRC